MGQPELEEHLNVAFSRAGGAGILMTAGLAGSLNALINATNGGDLPTTLSWGIPSILTITAGGKLLGSAAGLSTRRAVAGFTLAAAPLIAGSVATAYRVREEIRETLEFIFEEPVRPQTYHIAVQFTAPDAPEK